MYLHTNDFGAGTSYTDGTAVGNFWASDANLTMYEGVGKSYPFGLTFNVRNFNGILNYSLGTIVLSTELSKFTGNLNAQKQVVLNWTTTSETENASFIIERSQDGKEWVSIGQKEGAGTSTTPISYNYIDDNPLLGLSYYRLQYIDIDGFIEYSKRIKIHLSSPTPDFTIYPNPSSDGDVRLSTNFKNSFSLDVFNSLGDLVYHTHKAEEATHHNLELPILTKGIYTVQFTLNGTYVAKRMVII